jgi:hypothetical protein
MSNLSIFIPGERYGQGINLNFGDTDGDGKTDFGIGVRNYEHYGNGIAGVYGSNEIGLDSGRGVYLDHRNGSYNPFAQQHNFLGTDSRGVTQGSSTYMDILGNYQNNRFANDVWGNYSDGFTRANPFAFENFDRSGNIFSGRQAWAHQQGDIFGNFRWNASAPYMGGGGCGCARWFG